VETLVSFGNCGGIEDWKVIALLELFAKDVMPWFKD
jgi:hypothetical protein